MSKNAPRNQVLGHGAEADGIEEYDNPLPDWWVGLFWFTIIFAFGYTLHYHVIAHRSQTKALAAEMAAAKAKWPGGATAAFVPTPALAKAGEAIFKTNCVACHGEDLHGKIGPNLTDDVWIHGGRPQDIVNTITNGVPPKGMPTWGPILGPEKVREVASYVISMHGK